MVLNEIYMNYFQHLKVLQAWMGEMCNVRCIILPLFCQESFVHYDSFFSAARTMLSSS